MAGLCSIFLSYPPASLSEMTSEPNRVAIPRAAVVSLVSVVLGQTSLTMKIALSNASNLNTKEEICQQMLENAVSECCTTEAVEIIQVNSMSATFVQAYAILVTASW